MNNQPVGKLLKPKQSEPLKGRLPVQVYIAAQLDYIFSLRWNPEEAGKMNGETLNQILKT